jgi:hypothetical protein
MVEKDSVKKCSQRSRQAEQFSSDVGEEPEKKEEASLANSPVASQKSHFFAEVGDNKGTRQSHSHGAQNQNDEVEQHLEESVPVYHQFVRRFWFFETHDRVEQHNGHGIFDIILAENNRVQPWKFVLRNRLLGCSWIDTTETCSQQQYLPIRQSSVIINISSIDHKIPGICLIQQPPTDQKRHKSSKQPKQQNVLDILEEDTFVKRKSLCKQHRWQQDFKDDKLIQFGLSRVRITK